MAASELFLLTLGATAAVMVALWMVSLARKDASIVDIYWGLGFVFIALLGAAFGGGAPARRLLVAALTAAWGLRLAGYLFWRNAGHGEDYRYQAMRRYWGERFWWVSLFTVFGLQGVLMWLVSLPLQVAQTAVAPAHLGIVDGLGVCVWSVGIFFEAVGDWQLARFKADPSSAGKVMDRGLWRYTRHPNYFGDFCVWWGLYLVAAAVPGGMWTIVSPLLMSTLLVRVSGVAMLERTIVKRRPEYQAYIERTSAFLPRPPRGDRSISPWRVTRKDSDAAK